MKDYTNMYQLGPMPILGKKASIWCSYDNDFSIDKFFLSVPGAKNDLIEIEQQEIVDLLLDTFATDETIAAIRDFEVDNVNYDEPLTFAGTGCVRRFA